MTCIVNIYDSADRLVEIHKFDTVDQGNSFCDGLDLKYSVIDGSLYYDIEVTRV